MIQKLQKRLTFLCGLLTSLILLVTLAAAWHFSAEQYEANQKALFGTSFHFISDHIASGSVLRGIAGVPAKAHRARGSEAEEGRAAVDGGLQGGAGE